MVKDWHVIELAHEGDFWSAFDTASNFASLFVVDTCHAGPWPSRCIVLVKLLNHPPRSLFGRECTLDD